MLIRQGAELARQTAEDARRAAQVLQVVTKRATQLLRQATEAQAQLLAEMQRTARASRRIDQGPSGRKAGQHLLYLFGELCRLANYLPAHLMATATRV